MAVFMRNDIGLRELSRRAEALAQLVVEREVEIDVIVLRTIERPGRCLAQAAAERIGIETQFVRASSLGAAGARSEHLLAICRAVAATEYVSPTGSADYMEEDGVFAAAGFPVRFKPCRMAEYPQGRTEFTPYMSFVDALMNVGWSGLKALVSA